MAAEKQRARIKEEKVAAEKLARRQAEADKASGAEKVGSGSAAISVRRLKLTHRPRAFGEGKLTEEG